MAAQKKPTRKNTGHISRKVYNQRGGGALEGEGIFYKCAVASGK